MDFVNVYIVNKINYIYNFLQTTIHKFWVAFYILKACKCLLWRAIIHDMSKYSKYEAPYFARDIFKLKNVKYGTPEYQKILDGIKPALVHHYKHNAHHPQYWKNGMRDMSPLDQIELLCDWKSASRRHKNGNIRYSIETNAKRFRYDKIFEAAYVRAIKEMKL